MTRPEACFLNWGRISEICITMGGLFLIMHAGLAVLTLQHGISLVGFMHLRCLEKAIKASIHVSVIGPFRWCLACSQNLVRSYFSSNELWVTLLYSGSDDGPRNWT